MNIFARISATVSVVALIVVSATGTGLAQGGSRFVLPRSTNVPETAPVLKQPVWEAGIREAAATATVRSVPSPYATIQAAIDAASPGDVIDIAAGSYVENVVINKTLTVQGAGQASTFVYPATSNPNPCSTSSLCGGAASVIMLVQANSVVIHDMTLDGDNTSLTSGIVAGGADLDARIGIITNHLAGTYNGMEVYNVTVKNIYLRGIQNSSGTGFNVHNNTVQNVQAEGQSIAMFNSGGGGTFANNTVADANDAISANHSKGTQFLNNVITNSGSGVHTDNAGDGGGSADLLDGNTVSNSMLYGYGVWVFVPYIAPTVQNNVVTNVDVGMGAFAGAFSPAPTVNVVFLNNTIDGQSKANSAGFYITNTTWYWGCSNVSATFTNNIVKDNTDGFYIESNNGNTLTFNATFNLISGNTNGVTASFVPVIYGGAGSVGTVAGTMSCNWWGHISGPTTGSNPGGLGQSHNGTLPFAPWLIYGTDASPATAGFQLPATIAVASGGDLSAADNDFRRIQNAVGCAVNGQTIDLSGTFDWSQTNALASYTASYATSATADIRGAEIRAGVSNLTITSTAHNGRLIGGGDINDGSLIWSACLFTDDGPTTGNANLAVRYLDFDSFEAGVVLGWNATGTFNGATIEHNRFELAGDDGDAADWIQNIAIYLWHGTNQLVDHDTVTFKANGTRTAGYSGPANPASFALQSGTTGGTGYNGLHITNNVVQVGATSNGVEEVYGVWENGHNDNNSSLITISGNRFLGRSGDLLDHALKLSSQTTGLVLDANVFTDVDEVLFCNKSSGHSVGDRFTFTNNVLTGVGGPDGIFLRNVTNDVTPIHVGVYWDINNTIDGETGIRGLNELSTQATHASRPSGAASDLAVVYGLGAKTVTVADDNWGTPDRFSDPDGIGTGVGPMAYGFNTFTSVKTAIDSVSNSTVYVKAGSYTEGFPQVVISKDVSVIGEDNATTVISPGMNTGTAGDARGWILVNTGKTFNLSNVTLDGTGKLVNIGILSHGPGTIDNNIFRNLGYNPSTSYAGRGVALYDANMSVTNNQFTNIGRIGIYMYGSGASAAIVSGNTYTGKGDGNWLDYGIEVEGGAHATVSDNSITACTGVAATDSSTSAGLLITTYFALGSQATLTGNTFSGNTVGVNVGYAGDDQSTVVAHGNIFSGNTNYGVLTTNPFVDATYNYWGTLHGPTDPTGTLEVPRAPKPSVADMKNAVPAAHLGDSVTANVDYYPWIGPGNGNGVWAGGYVNPASNNVFAGFDPAALDGVDPFDTVAPPPPPSDYLYLYFLTAPDSVIKNYSADIKKDEASLFNTAKRWSLRAITDHTSSSVSISLITGLSLPLPFRPTLYDETTGAYQDVREDPIYTYTSPATETPYPFLLLMGDSALPSVAVTAPNGGEYLIVGTPYNVTWTASDESGILRHYVYYSDSGSAPYTLIDSTNMGVTTYAWTPSVATTAASIKVVARDSVLNEWFDVSDQTFAVLSSGTVSLSASPGWNLVSPPVVQGDMTPSGVFGDDYGATPYYVFQFSPGGGYSVPSVLSMGQGYWLGSNSAQAVDASGTPVSAATRPLAAGFNIIGNPFATDLQKADLMFTNGILTKNMADAAVAGWLSDVLYAYDGSGYVFESTGLGVWRGYWIPILVPGISVEYSPSVFVPTPKVSPEPPAADRWTVDLGASMNVAGRAYTDRVAAFGVRAEATANYDRLYDAPRPPRSPAQEFIEIGFPVAAQDAGRVPGAAIARDFRPPGEARWEFTVTASGAHSITLSWDAAALAAVPAGVRLELFDVARRQTVDMRETGSYTFTPAGTSAAFVINGRPENGAPAVPEAFVLGQNYPNPFNPTTRIAFGLPQDAHVRLSVFTLLGQKVAELVDGPLPAGEHETVFDAAGLADGIYVYRIDAVAADGTHFGAQHKMTLLK